jgi:hypothetical protein
VRDGDVVQWLGVLARLRLLAAATLLPGHGEVGDAATLDDMVDCLEALLAGAGAFAPDSEAPTLAIPERFRAWGGERSAGRSLSDWWHPGRLRRRWGPAR